VRLVLSDDLNPVVKQDQPLIPVQANGREVQGHVTLIPETVNCPVDIRAREDVVQMRVLPTIVGEPPEGYLFGGRVVVDPPSVGVTGDRLAISQLTLISTEPIDLSDQTETFTAEVALDLPPGVNVMAENETVRVTVTITSVPTSRRFDGIRVEVAGLDSSLYHYSGLPETVTVTVVGPPSELPEREDVRVIVDLSGLPAGNHQVTPQGLILGEDELDPSVSISVLPQQLSVTIEAVNPTATPSPTPTAEAGAAAATLPPPSDNEQPGADVITATPAGQP
jgi:YbbR domain-containing protein